MQRRCGDTGGVVKYSESGVMMIRSKCMLVMMMIMLVVVLVWLKTAVVG